MRTVASTARRSPDHAVAFWPWPATEMTTRRHTLALVRYRLIAEATTAPRGARTRLLRVAASKEVAWPDGGAVCVSVRTLQRWLPRFERGG